MWRLGGMPVVWSEALDLLDQIQCVLGFIFFFLLLRWLEKGGVRKMASVSFNKVGFSSHMWMCCCWFVLKLIPAGRGGEGSRRFGDPSSASSRWSVPGPQLEESSQDQGSVVRCRAHQRWLPWRSNGACSCRVNPAVVALSPYLQAEGRPILFLPAKMPKGRQFGFWLGAMVVRHGDLVAPSGSVPGDGEVHPEWKLRTRSRFSILARGPFCKVQGLMCNFQFSVCLAIMCVLVIVYE